MLQFEYRVILFMICTYNTKRGGAKLSKRIFQIVVILVLVVAIVLSLSACESAEEKRSRELREQAEQARAYADEAREQYQKLQDDIARYNRLQDALNNAK